MSAEINAVRDTIKDIIDAAESGESAPSGYILAPYESSVSLTLTRNTTLVKEELDALTNSGGTELTFGALQVNLDALNIKYFSPAQFYFRPFLLCLLH